MYNSTGGYGGLSGLPTQAPGFNAAGTLPPVPGIGSNGMPMAPAAGTMGLDSAGSTPAVMPGAGLAMGGNSAMGLVDPATQDGWGNRMVAPPAPLSPDMAALSNALIGGALQGRASPAMQNGMSPVSPPPNAMNGLFGMSGGGVNPPMTVKGGWG